MPAFLVASLILHALVGLIFWHESYDVDFPPPQPVISVDLVTVADITNLTPVAKSPLVEEEKSPPPPPPPEPPPPPPPPPPEEPAPVILPDQQEMKKKPPEEKPKKVEAPPPDIVARPKEAKKKKPKKKDVKKPRVDPLVSVLLNVEKLQEPPVAKDPLGDLDIPDVEGDVSKPLTLSQIDAIKRHFQRCWIVPAGSLDAMKMIPAVRLQINPDGTIASSELIEEHERRRRRDNIFRAAAEAALRAVRNPLCRRLTLPPEQYSQWKSIVIDFDPREMSR